MSWASGFIPVRPAEGIERFGRVDVRFLANQASSRYDPLRVLKDFGESPGGTEQILASSRYDPLRVLKVDN